ncbi:ABC transporter permease [Corynebacterium sp. Q4381]|uniref:ABC transporter permease n=1 Tax=Corynebacterium sp. Marseille-Q4381 TaxID=3121597 RepID=UPI002FE621A3
MSADANEQSLFPLDEAHETRTDSFIVINRAGLREQSEREALGSYLKRLWGHRFFIYQDAHHRAFGLHQDKFLGRLWIILEPLLFAAMYGFMFGVILNTSRGIENFVGYVILGTTFFRILQQSLTSGSGLMKASKPLISSFNFPRAAIVFGAWTKNVLTSLAPVMVAIVLALCAQWGNWPGWEILAVVPLFLLVHVFGLGLTLITARLTAIVPDVKSLIPVIGRAWFYISGVFFLPEKFDNSQFIQDAMQLNPAYRFLDAVRGAVMYHSLPATDEWVYMAVWSVTVAIAGFTYFWLAEGRYAQVR